jgi:hypothetical protein
MGELRERKREVHGEVVDGNELDAEGKTGVLGGLDLGGLPTVSKGVCKGKKIVVEVDKSTWVGNGKVKGNWYAPLSFPSNFFVNPWFGKRGSPEARVQILT